MHLLCASFDPRPRTCYRHHAHTSKWAGETTAAAILSLPSISHVDALQDVTTSSDAGLHKVVPGGDDANLSASVAGLKVKLWGDNKRHKSTPPHAEVDLARDCANIAGAEFETSREAETGSAGRGLCMAMAACSSGSHDGAIAVRGAGTGDMLANGRGLRGGRGGNAALANGSESESAGGDVKASTPTRASGKRMIQHGAGTVSGLTQIDSRVIAVCCDQLMASCSDLGRRPLC